jgi:hypothetical protein
VLVADALPASPFGRDNLVLDHCGARTTVLRKPGRPEELLLCDGMRHARLTLRSGTVAEGPVRLRFALRGLRDLERQILTLRQVVALARSGSLPRRLAGTDPKTAYWIALLRTHDALVAGASQRDIADCLFDKGWVASGWDGRSDFMRSRLRRMVVQQRRLIDGGYRRLLR